MKTILLEMLSHTCTTLWIISGENALDEIYIDIWSKLKTKVSHKFRFI